jgi:hypothetical protein
MGLVDSSVETQNRFSCNRVGTGIIHARNVKPGLPAIAEVSVSTTIISPFRDYSDRHLRRTFCIHAGDAVNDEMTCEGSTGPFPSVTRNSPCVGKK